MPRLKMKTDVQSFRRADGQWMRRCGGTVREGMILFYYCTQMSLGEVFPCGRLQEDSK